MMSLQVLVLLCFHWILFYKCISLIQIVTERISVFDFDEADQLSFTEFYKIFFQWTSLAQWTSTPAWKIPWIEEPGGLQSTGSLRVGHAWGTSLSTFMHWRRKWQHTPVFLPGESQGWGSLVDCRLWGRTELDMTEAPRQQQQAMTNLDSA